MGRPGEEPYRSTPKPAVEQHVSGYGNIFTGSGDVHVTQEVSPGDGDDQRNLDRLNDDVRLSLLTFERGA
jgi:hypothetical protein